MVQNKWVSDSLSVISREIEFPVTVVETLMKSLTMSYFPPLVPYMCDFHCYSPLSYSMTGRLNDRESELLNTVICVTMVPFEYDFRS